MPDEIVYTPESDLKQPILLARRMGRDLLASRELAWLLLTRDLRARYRQSLLGFAWDILPPVAMAVGLTLARDADILSVDATTIPYPAFVMLGMVLWQTFLDAMNGPVRMVTAARSMLARVNFPREAIILASLGEVLIGFAIKIVLVAALFAWYGIAPASTAWVAPVALLGLILLGTFFGVLAAPLAVLFQDVPRGLAAISGFWLLLTPVAFPIPRGGAFATLVGLNPVTPLLATTRELTTTGVVSDPARFGMVGAATLLGLLLTWVAFRLAMPFAIERVGS